MYLCMYTCIHIMNSISLSLSIYIYIYIYIHIYTCNIRNACMSMTSVLRDAMLSFVEPARRASNNTKIM